MKAVATNRRARFDYEVLETITAGIMLTGQEAKSCRMGHVDLSGSYVSFHAGKPMIKHLKIMPYKFASGLDGYDPAHERVLLLKKSELEKLKAMSDQKGVSIIPLEVQAGKFIKLLLGIAKGRKTLDKRRTIKERDVERRMRQGREV